MSDRFFQCLTICRERKLIEPITTFTLTKGSFFTFTSQINAVRVFCSSDEFHLTSICESDTLMQCRSDQLMPPSSDRMSEIMTRI